MEELEKEEGGTSRPVCRSKFWAHEDQCDELSGFREVVRDVFSKVSKIQGEERDAVSKIREEQRDGLSESRRLI